MITIKCDRCERDITVDSRYLLEVKNEITKKPELTAFQLCAFCMVEVKGFLHET